MLLVPTLAKLGKLQRERALVKSANISDAAKHGLLAQIDAQERSLEAEIAAQQPGAVQAPQAAVKPPSSR